MRAGGMRDRMRFEMRGAASAAYVSGAENWSTVQDAWAMVRPLAASRQDEAEVAGRMTDLRSFLVEVRYTPELATMTTAGRITDLGSGDVFNIRHIMDPDSRRERLVFTADQGRPGE